MNRSWSEDAVNIMDITECVGDGIVDDSDELQAALTYCSDRGLVAYIPANTALLVTKPLFVWGGCSLIGEDRTSRIYIRTSSPYVFNFGLRDKLVQAPVWSGAVENVSFHALHGSGRILFFWRVDGSVIRKNRFYLNDTLLGSMSSGNNNAWLVDGPSHYVRKNLKVVENVVVGKGEANGSEGIGLNQWDTAEIAYNVVRGVADDAVGIHFCKSIHIHHNTLSSTDGRLFVAQSTTCRIEHNYISRAASSSSKSFMRGIALLYIGHEGDVTNSHPAPTDITVEENELVYPDGSIDNGAAIVVYGPRNVTLIRNSVRHDSASGSQVGIHVMPFVYQAGTWTDPTGVEKDGVSRVRSLTCEGNHLAAGKYSCSFKMTGQTVAYYVGPVTINNTVASAYSLLGNPSQSGNTVRS